jgi:hypothetical protein
MAAYRLLPGFHSRWILWLKEMRELAATLWLLGNPCRWLLITEEALPTYESWLMDEGVNQMEGKGNAWSKCASGLLKRTAMVMSWIFISIWSREHARGWGDYTTMIADGFDIGTDRDPYKNFVYQFSRTGNLHFTTAKILGEYGSTTACVVLYQEMRCVT